jgi:hypothetical protein
MKDDLDEGLLYYPFLIYLILASVRRIATMSRPRMFIRGLYCKCNGTDLVIVGSSM